MSRKNGYVIMKDKERNITTVSEENIYVLNGRVPLGKAIPFGLQHVLAMFVANLAPVLIVCSAALVRGTGDHLTAVEITRLLQCAMFVAGIGTCLQLYPIWKIGSKLPIVMGVSFTFLGSLLMICTNPDLGYEGMIGAIILGGIFEGVVGLSAQYWKKYLTPVVSSCVVIAIGLSLLPVGMNSWGGGSGSESFGSWYHLFVGLVTLIVCLVSRYLLHGVYKNLNILVGLIFGYILSAIFTVAGIAPMIDFSGISKTISEIGFFSLPRLVFLCHLEQAVHALESQNITAALEALYEVDNNCYAFLFDEEVYYHFTEYILHQPKDRLMWGAGRILHHENLFGLVQRLKELDQMAIPGSLDLEIRRLEAAIRRQQAYLKDDLHYMKQSVDKIQALINDCLETSSHYNKEKNGENQ